MGRCRPALAYLVLLRVEIARFTRRLRYWLVPSADAYGAAVASDDSSLLL